MGKQLKGSILHDTSDDWYIFNSDWHQHTIIILLDEQKPQTVQVPQKGNAGLRWDQQEETRWDGDWTTQDEGLITRKSILDGREVVHHPSASQRGERRGKERGDRVSAWSDRTYEWPRPSFWQKADQNISAWSHVEDKVRHQDRKQAAELPLKEETTSSYEKIVNIALYRVKLDMLNEILGKKQRKIITQSPHFIDLLDV